MSQAEQAAATAGTSVYVLGVTREAPAALADLPRLLPDWSLETVAAPGLCALACTVPADLVDEHLADDLVRLGGLAAAHDRVLRALAGRTAVVPARLGSIYPSRRAVEEMLGRQRQALSATLDRLTGRSEWGVKVLAAGRPPAPGQGRPAGDDPGSGTAYLRRKRAEGRQRVADRQALAALVSQLHGDLAGLAQAAVSRPPQAPAALGQPPADAAQRGLPGRRGRPGPVHGPGARPGRASSGGRVAGRADRAVAAVQLRRVG
jgi:hypothetical protein